MRTKFIQYKPHQCGLEFVNFAGVYTIVEYYAAADGGYVTDQDGNQVCNALCGRGPALWWSNSAPLIDLIRKEYRKHKKLFLLVGGVYV